MIVRRKYNTLLVTGTTAIRICIVKRGVVDHALAADWTPASGDVKISIDGAAPANVTNLPVATASGNSAVWEFVLTAAELTCKQAIVTISDSATKAIEDDGFIVETFGHASAMYAADLSAANLPANAIQIGGTNQTGLDLAANWTAARAAKVDNLDATVSSRAAPGAAMTLEAGERTSIGTAVWSSATRTLTSFGSLITDIWSNVTRTLTSGGGGGSTTVVVAPVVGTIQFNTITSSGTVQAFQYCPLPTGPITLVDGNDDPVDVSGGTVKMICVDTADKSKSFTLTTADGDGLTVGGDNGNQISVDYLPVLSGLYERKTFHKPDGGDWQVREFGFWNIVPGPDPREA